MLRPNRAGTFLKWEQEQSLLKKSRSLFVILLLIFNFIKEQLCSANILMILTSMSYALYFVKLPMFEFSIKIYTVLFKKLTS